MNLHVIIVHFPVALLTLYSLLELIRFRIVREFPAWFYIKGFLVVFGALGAFAAVQTGELIESQFEGVRDVVEMHSLFGTITMYGFGFIALMYILAWIQKSGILIRLKEGTMKRKLQTVVASAETVVESPFMFVLGVIGLVVVTITGALGGSIAFGSSIDPVAGFVVKLFHFKESI